MLYYQKQIRMLTIKETIAPNGQRLSPSHRYAIQLKSQQLKIITNKKKLNRNT